MLFIIEFLLDLLIPDTIQKQDTYYKQLIDENKKRKL